MGELTIFCVIVIMAASLLLVQTALFGLSVGLFGEVLLRNKSTRMGLLLVGSLLLQAMCLPFWLHMTKLISVKEYWLGFCLHYTCAFLLWKHVRAVCNTLMSFLYIFTSLNLLCLLCFRTTLSSMGWDLQCLSVLFVFQRRPFLVGTVYGGAWIFVRSVCEWFRWKSGSPMMFWIVALFWCSQTFLVPHLRGSGKELFKRFVCGGTLLIMSVWLVMKLTVPLVLLFTVSGSTGVDCLLLLYWVVQWADVSAQQFYAALRTAAVCFVLAMIRYQTWLVGEWMVLGTVLFLHGFDGYLLGGTVGQWNICKYVGTMIWSKSLSRPQREPEEERLVAPAVPPEPVVVEKEDQELDSQPSWWRDLEELDEDDDGLCVVCLEHRACVALIPCGHTTTCDGCTESVLQRDPLCPLCRTPITQTLRIYR